MTDKQPEALRMADALEQGTFLLSVERDATAAELRRLHQSEREGWRHAEELEQERERLTNLCHDYLGELTAMRAAKQMQERINEIAKQEHAPSRTQTKQIVDGLQRCHHPDSQHEFLRTWIRDWTIHKTAQRQWVGLTDEAIWSEYQTLWPFHPAEEPRLAKDVAKFARAIEVKLREKNAA